MSKPSGTVKPSMRILSLAFERAGVGVFCLLLLYSQFFIRRYIVFHSYTPLLLIPPSCVHQSFEFIGLFLRYHSPPAGI
ncbi:unnamed protein product [Nippostrongylus brasiliensis]|uniref:Secreted protein n=1 Tax=Nippostrongylus brasiliensis TaxID=27835 RepID=A0A0N4XM08_NIPBR|nr:unnamed protein product [Nippostrongylus brasiliensis]